MHIHLEAQKQAHYQRNTAQNRGKDLKMEPVFILLMLSAQ